MVLRIPPEAGVKGGGETGPKGGAKCCHRSAAGEVIGRGSG